ncbi:MAG: hypothetical protein AAGB04_24135 [Pseudomonadota bacterium]
MPERVLSVLLGSELKHAKRLNLPRGAGRPAGRKSDAPDNGPVALQLQELKLDELLHAATNIKHRADFPGVLAAIICRTVWMNRLSPKNLDLSRPSTQHSSWYCDEHNKGTGLQLMLVDWCPFFYVHITCEPH